MSRESHNSRASSRRSTARDATGTPARDRALRAQGRKTMERLSDAGLRIFARRGYHETRVDDIVRAARTSHGTFYLYFANKEDLLRSLAVECAHAIDDVAGRAPSVSPDAAGEVALDEFLRAFLGVYAHYGVVIRAWMERQVADRKVDKLGVDAFTHIARALGRELDAAGAPSDPATVAALMAMLERTSYAMTSRDLGIDADAARATLTRVIHRGFFLGTR